MFKRLLLVMVLLLSFTAISAQEITPLPDAELNPEANITWPPPVYTLRGEVDVRGSANMPGMLNYFLEFRPLEFPTTEEADAEASDTTATDEDSAEDDAPWFPMTLPATEPVDGGILGTWNTRTTSDDLYEIRLRVNIAQQDPVYFYVSPLRVENNPPDFVTLPTATQQPVVDAQPTPIPTFARPTLAATPTPFDTTPQVTALTNANVREGDSTAYPPISQLLQGQTARIVGISSSGNGWYFIELEDGRRGFIAPSTVRASGDTSSVPRINPPATPTPTPTNTPVPSGDLAASPPDIEPDQPICGQQFNVLVNITNAGTSATTASATIIIQDVRASTGEVQASLAQAVPPLAPGENFVVGGPFTVSTFYGEEHQIVARLDTDNAITESNENNNVVSTTYTLQQGTCP